MEIENIAIGKLKNYDRNSRTHSPEQVEQLKKSIAEFGFTNPVLVDEKNVIIAGHGRRQAAAEIGMKELPCVRLSGLSEAQKKALRIADNALALNAGWDDEKLRAELDALKLENYDLEFTGLADLEARLEELKEPFDLERIEAGDAQEFIATIKFPTVRALEKFLSECKAKIETEFDATLSVRGQ